MTTDVDGARFELEAYRDEVEAWREDRYASIRHPLGYLTLVGLDWLRPGVNSIGSHPSSDIVLPSGPEHAGSITISDGTVTADGSFTRRGLPAQRLRLPIGDESEPILLELGALRLRVVEFGGRPALRTWDIEAVARREFRGVEHWPIEPAWLIHGCFESTPGRTLLVPNALGDTVETPSPGDIVFNVVDAQYRLQALASHRGPGEMILLFGDATNRVETYGGGRRVFVATPDEDGHVVVDFNRAHNPKCAFTPFATCPLAWPANRLPIRVTAGEKAPTSHGSIRES